MGLFCRRYGRARGLYPLDCRLFRPARRLPGVYNMSKLQCELPGPFSTWIVSYHTAGRFWSRCCCALHETPCREGRPYGRCGRSFLFTTCRHLSAWNRNSVPLASSVSTARDAYAAADGVRGACTPSSVVYSDTPDTGVHNLPLHTCEEPVPNSVGIVCADHAGRLRSRCYSALF